LYDTVITPDVPGRRDEVSDSTVDGRRELLSEGKRGGPVRGRDTSDGAGDDRRENSRVSEREREEAFMRLLCSSRLAGESRVSEDALDAPMALGPGDGAGERFFAGFLGRSCDSASCVSATIA
jgi:hypothetical protein